MDVLFETGSQLTSNRPLEFYDSLFGAHPPAHAQLVVFVYAVTV